jgi:hypothetical protein
MASIGASTKHKVSVPTTMKTTTASKPPASKPTAMKIGQAKKPVAKKGAGGKRGSAPPLKPGTLVSAKAIADLKALDKETQKNKVIDLCQKAMGEQTLVDKSKPHAASTTRDRSGAAADVAVAAQELGISFVLRECNVVDAMQRMLFPEGIQSMFNHPDGDNAGRLKASSSALSLSSMGGDDTTVTSAGNTAATDSKRGKVTPADAREGSLLLIRAFCQTLGKKVEPYVVGAFLAAALDECGSNSGMIREAAEDAATALVELANPWAFPFLLAPLLLQSLNAAEWRVKFNALQRLAQTAKTSPNQVCRMLPVLIPAVTNQVWDTKPQVTKAASSALLAICSTCNNQDIEPAIPAVVNAISKPSDTNKAIEELMGTTFVVAVDAPSLAILCPVLARALKEKLAIHKRAACIVISNMSRLVSSPTDVAPFGPLLVPELKRVAENVQFEEIRDEALKALKFLTKALGAAYAEDEGEDDAEKAAEVAAEQAKVEAEQKRIKDERDAEDKKNEEIRLREEEERKRFKEAMDAQRELDKIAADEARTAKAEEDKKREQLKLSTKGETGKCQGCGLKKCKKTCHFYAGP